MSKRLLPKTGTPEAEAVKSRFANGEYESLVKELGFANIGSLKRSISSTYGIKVGGQPVSLHDEPVVQHVP